MKSVSPLATEAEHTRAEAFRASLEAKGRTKNTLMAYQSDWRALASWHSKERRRPFDLTALEPGDCTRYAEHLARSTATSTAVRRILFLRAYVRWSGVGGAVGREVESLKIPRVERRGPLGVPTGILKKRLEGLRSAPLRDRAILELLLFGGFRASEVATLRREDIQSSRAGAAARVRAAAGKGFRERVVPLSPRASRLIRSYLRERTDRDPNLFRGKRGKLSYSGVYRLVRRYFKTTPHRLRHSFASEYLSKNPRDLEGLAQILGHSSISTTWSYARRRVDELARSIGRVRY